MSMMSIKLEIEGFQDRKKNEWERTEYQSWLTGYYTLRGTAMLFSKKNKYPDNPLEKDEVEIDVEGLSDYELAELQEKELEKLDLMARLAFGIDKDKKNGD